VTVIVVGIDGSENSKDALRLAAAEAALHGAKLRVVCSWHLPESLYMGGWAPGIDVTSGFEEAARDIAAEALVDLARLQPGLDTESDVVRGHAAAALVEESRDSDLLVVGSRGLGGFRSLLLGSVSDQVAHHASCPVMIVRSSGRPGSADLHGGVIVVGVDGSPGSEAALRFALEEARLRQATLRVVCAWESAGPSVLGPGLTPGSGEAESAREVEATREHRSRAQGTVERMVGELQREAQGVRLERRSCEGEPISVLVDESERSDLLVVGSRGRGGFASTLLGSVSRECAHHAGCPVVIVPSGERTASDAESP
jgi:nucleotide-binding universal stress UspA family protein